MITINGKNYEVPDTYKIVIDDKETEQTIATAVIQANRQQYYADKYGNGKHADLTQIVSAATKSEVVVSVISDDHGVCAETDTGLLITIAQATPKAKKVKKEVIEVEEVEIDIDTE